MPKSRGRFGRKRRLPKRKFDVRTEVSKFFESIGLNPEQNLRFPVLYHYTSTFAALKILESQTFWATAHDCTLRYGDGGKGVCLGIKVINEREPLSRELFSRLFQVVYTEDALREWFSDAFGKTCSALPKYPASDKNVKLALASLRGLAAFASLTTKAPEWSSEQEVRHVTMDRLEPGVKPHVRTSAGGKEARYLPVSLRAAGKLIAMDEIIIGAKQDFDEIREQFRTVLASKGYLEGIVEYPRFAISHPH